MNKKAIEPTSTMPIVGFPLHIFDLETQKPGGIGFINVTRQNNCTFLNILVTPSFKDESGSYQKAGQFNIRIPIKMLYEIIMLIKKNWGLNFQRKKRIKWQVKTHSSIKQ